MTTVKDLKKLIEKLPDDTPLVIKDWEEENSFMDVESIYTKNVLHAISIAIDFKEIESVVFDINKKRGKHERK